MTLLTNAGESIEAANSKYSATIRRMSDCLALKVWDELEPNDKKLAWLLYTRPYWEEMAKLAYHSKHQSEK